MANDVFANGREISCKSGAGKSICAFPDVCFTPPENPTTPPGVPIPYPNTGMARDTTSGSKKVKITNKEIMLKNRSYFKKSIGDEAGCAAKKGVITSVNRGKVYFIAWSMDVKVEGENVVRHLDMTTHNHPSATPNTPPTIHIDSMAVAFPESCRETVEESNEHCDGAPVESDGVDCDKAKDPDKCKAARACLLVAKELDKKFCCKPDTTGHHLVEVNNFSPSGGRAGLASYMGFDKVADLRAVLRDIGFSDYWGDPGSVSHAVYLRQFARYDEEAAPTICVSATVGYNEHGAMHAATEREKSRFSGNVTEVIGRDFDGNDVESKWKLKDAIDAGVKAVEAVRPDCDPDCCRDQLNEYHVTRCRIDPETNTRTYTDQNYTEGERWLRDRGR